MLPRVRIMLLIVLPCLFFSLGIDAIAQVGRLAGTVAYAAPGVRPVVASGVRVVVISDYTQLETRTDSNGNFELALRAANYRVVAQGAPGYVTYGPVWGYVRANTNSVITPNPLFLVPQSTRMSDGITNLPLSYTAIWNKRALMAGQNNLTLETAARNSSNGKLSGNVRYKNKDTDKPA
jgi:hypothetical protein